MSKKIPIPKPFITRRWIGEGYGPGLYARGAGDRFYLIEVRLTPVLDKRGRPITRRAK